MGQNELHKIAQADAPSMVEIPRTKWGLAAWLIGKFGIGVLFAGVFAWWLMRVYADLRLYSDNVLTAYQAQAVATSQTAIALQQLTFAVEKIGNIQKEVDRNSADINELKRKSSQ